MKAMTRFYSIKYCYDLLLQYQALLINSGIKCTQYYAMGVDNFDFTVRQYLLSDANSAC